MRFVKQIWVMILIVVILGVCITVIHWLGTREKQSIYLSQPTPSPHVQALLKTSSTSLQSSGQAVPIAVWKTYINQKYGFSFQYPSEAKVTVTNDIHSQFYLTLTHADEEIDLYIRPGQSHMFASPTGTYTLNNLTWQVIPSGGRYCDAGQCGTTPRSYQFFRQEPCNQSNIILGMDNTICGHTFEFALKNPEDIIIKTILSTFTFTSH